MRAMFGAERADGIAACARKLLVLRSAAFIGFIVDAGIAAVARVRNGTWIRYRARLISFLCAATTTWIFNRKFTFAGTRRQRQLALELMRYVIAMSGGFALQLRRIFGACIFSIVREWPAIAVAAGSIAGAVVNFLARDTGFSAHPKGKPRLSRVVPSLPGTPRPAIKAR